jgi:chemotaxis protein methyltransferase CheR
MPMTSNNKNISSEQLSKLSHNICQTIGLEFPENKYKDLTRAIEDACGDFGFSNAYDCIEWLIHTNLKKETWDKLARYLTIGETYFFRDSGIIKLLKDNILHNLIYSRWQTEKYLRIWSAACCSGEEPYSIAILIDQLLSNRKGWNISIIGTDINEKFLEKAKKGLYTQWSFRTTPENIQNKYFTTKPDNKFAIHPDIKRMVAFFYLNLAESGYPNFANNTTELDLICCRNVLMYFSETVREKVVRRMASCLALNGCLIVSPGEADYAKKAGLTPLRSSETTVFKKMPSSRQSISLHHQTPAHQSNIPDYSQKKLETKSIQSAIKPIKKTVAPKKQQQTYDQALQVFNTGAYQECIQILESIMAHENHNAANMILMARSYANLKQYETAKSWCEKAINQNRLDPGYYHLMASILQEQGNIEETIKALNQALYLEPSFIMAYVSIGMIRRKQGRQKECQKAIDNALYYLNKMGPDDLVPFSDDMTSGRLINMLESMFGT